MELEHLKVLEGKLGKLLDQHEQLRRENRELKDQLRQAEQRVAEMAQRLELYEKERGEARSRLEKLIARLDGLGTA
ncbi:MAG: hypothetical protein KatS3mg076_1075 [Candidatus Binatia bacterium]|nr:MAG: hypothetical protein KatS3mg076_1075 [Candidatus Binatia bacterium]